MEHSISGKKTGVPKERNSRKVLVVCSGPQEMVKVLFKKKDQKKRTATSRLECLRRTRKIVLRYLKKFRTSAGVSFSKIVKTSQNFFSRFPTIRVCEYFKSLKFSKNFQNFFFTVILCMLYIHHLHTFCKNAVGVRRR